MEAIQTTSEGPGIRPRALLTYVLLFVAPLVPLAALGVVAYDVASRSVDELIRSNNASAATITRYFVEEEFDLRVNGMRAMADTPGFVAALRGNDAAGVRQRLRALVTAHPNVIRAFVTDPAGVLWSDYPEAPESLGENFAFREWYQGLSANWEPYVSAVYQRHAEPRLMLIAIAVPVRDPETGDVLGAMVSQLDLEGLTELLVRVTVGTKGHVLLLDHRGNVVAHPHLDLQQQVHRDYTGTLVDRADEEQPVSMVYSDPVSGASMLATATPCAVLGETWTVIAQQPVAEAYQPLRTLRMQIAGAGLLFAVILAGFLGAMVRSDSRVRRLSVQLSGVNAELNRENEVRRDAEAKLAQVNSALEQRVEERTRQVQDMQLQLLQAQKMEAVGRLAGGVAHDFNNLLTVISGYAAILSKSELDDEDRVAVDEIRDAADRAASVTRQLLAFSRRQVLKPVNLDVNTVVERMERMLRRLIGEDVALATHLEPDLHAVYADPGQIEQIVMNLAVNARDAMPDGGKLTIRTENVELDKEYAASHADAQPGPHVMLAVTDTGEGMTAEARERLFEPFFTTKEVGRGTGLGLSTVYGIVKQSGGNIWVYSEPGRGTVFKVYLPAVAAAPVEESRPVNETPNLSGTETILVVEDEAALRKLIERLLTANGYRVLTAASPEEALALCGEDVHLDLLLTDVVLPEMNGRELAEKVQGLVPGIRVAFMSGYTDDAIVHHGVLEEGIFFIEKPIAPDQLARKVRQALD